MPFDGAEVSGTTERLVIGRARIEAGWCQGNAKRISWTLLHGKRVEYCLAGAISDGVPLEYAARMVHFLEAAIGRGPMSIPSFNDQRGRTKAQVLEVLDLAIAMSRGGSWTKN